MRENEICLWNASELSEQVASINRWKAKKKNATLNKNNKNVTNERRMRAEISLSAVFGIEFE